jgi:excisionase family DNA binding protein
LLLRIGNQEHEKGPPLFLSNQDLKAHAHGIGASRTGKSKLIEHIAREFIKARRGFCLIDPSGFLYQDLVQYLAYVRPGREDIVLFNPSYEERVVGFNPFHLPGAKTEAAIAAKVDRMVAATLKALEIRDPANAPRMERVMRCLYYVLIEQDLSIEAIHYFLSPRYFHLRDAIIDRTQSAAIKDQWLMLTENKRPEAYLNIVESTANRLFKFLTQQTVKRIIGISENAFDLERIVNNRGSLLVNLQTSLAFSQESARIIGTLLVDQLWETVRKRTRDEMRKLPPFFLIVDEFQNFATPEFAQMLDQAAKYGLHLVLFHQNLGQLDAGLKTALTACHTRFVFGGITQADAAYMLEGSIPSYEDLRLDIAGVPSQSQRHYLLKRPDQPLEHAFTPTVHEYRVTEEKVEKYVSDVTKNYLTPDEIDRLLAQPLESPALKSAVQEKKIALPDGKQEPTPPVVKFNPGKGGKHHQEIQAVIKRIAESCGFQASVEKNVVEGTGSIDVSLEKENLRIACEVSVTSSADYEMKNALKCLSEGYDYVLTVVSNQKKIPVLEKKLQTVIPVVHRSRVKALSLSGLLGFLRELTAPLGLTPSRRERQPGQRLNFTEACEFFDVNASTLYRWVRDGRIPFYRPGREYQFDRDELALIGREERAGKRKTSVEVEPLRIEKPGKKDKKKQDARYRKLLKLE